MSALEISHDPARGEKLILLADDSRTVRKLVSKVLQSAGYEFKYFEDGSELIGYLRDNADTVTPSAILLDVEMPIMDGLTTCREIRHALLQVVVPIIFFTSVKVADDDLRYEEVGGDEYIVKPFAPEKLIERLDYWTGLNITGG